MLGELVPLEDGIAEGRRESVVTEGALVRATCRLRTSRRLDGQRDLPMMSREVVRK